MDKKILNQLNLENAEAICQKIREDAEAEAGNFLARSQKEADNIIKEASLEAEKKKEASLKDLEREIGRIKERILSTLNLEKKRLQLSQKSKFVEAVLEAVKQRSQDFRQRPEYAHFLEKAILEGIEVIAEAKVEVFYSYLDEAIFHDGFIKKVEKTCSEVLKKHCSIKLAKSDFRDLGVIVNSLDGRMLYDNRFLGRLKRIYDEVYMELLKEVG